MVIILFEGFSKLALNEELDNIDELQKQDDFRFIKNTIDCFIPNQSLDKPDFEKNIIIDKRIQTSFAHCLWKNSNIHGLDASFYLNLVDTLIKCLNKNRPKGALSGKSFFNNIVDLFYVMSECYNPNLCECDGIAAFSKKLKECQNDCYNKYNDV